MLFVLMALATLIAAGLIFIGAWVIAVKFLGVTLIILGVAVAVAILLFIIYLIFG